MFRKNEGYKQRGLFDMTERLTKKQKQMLLNSKEHIFFEHIFKNIDEGRKISSIIFDSTKSS